MRIAFLTEEHPIVAGPRLVYCRFRFYGAMVAEIAKTLGADRVDLIGLPESVKSPEDWLARQESFLADPQRAEEVYLFKQALGPTIRVDHRLVTLDEPQPEYDLVLFGILNGSRNRLKAVMDHWLRVVERSKGYLYLDSDQEMSPRANVFYSHSVTFTQALADLPISHPFRAKLRGFVCTEPPERGYFQRVSDTFGVPAVYCPVVDYHHLRGLHTIEQVPKKIVDMMFLKYFDRWEANEDFKTTFLGWLRLQNERQKASAPKIAWYETSFPAAKAKKLDQFAPYGIEYRPAKFWRRETMAEKLGEAMLYCGLSTPNGNRFTFKIVEAVKAGTLTLVPDLRRVLPDLPTDSQKLYLRYTEAATGFDRRVDYLGKRLGHEVLEALQGTMGLDLNTYGYALREQRQFFNSYFVAGSPHITARMAEITRLV